MKKVICLLLVLVFTASALIGCAPNQSPYHESQLGQESQPDQNSYKVYQLAKASYPNMATYPNEKSPNFDAEYDAWSEDKSTQLNQADGYKDGLNPFFIASIKEYLSGAGQKNKVYSPVNVFMALSMLAEITAGNSRAQILELLGSENIESLRGKASAVWNANYCDDGAVTSILANSLWLNENIGFNQETVDTLAEKYYASSFRGEMGSDEFNKAIQGWLNEQTGGLLKEQAKGVEFDPTTILALASTVYFKAKWSKEFSKSATEDGIFHAADSDITCKFMSGSGAGNYYYSDKYAAVPLGLEGSGRMWLILPDEDVSADTLLCDDKTYDLFLPTGTDVANKYLIVNMKVPQFDIVSDIDLTDGLKKLGVTDVFDFTDSDFSPITTDTDEIAITEAKHAARVMIDEKGCTAAAYTVMIVAGTAEPPEETVDFVLDRPFIFVITGADGLPLFTGVVNQPK